MQNPKILYQAILDKHDKDYFYFSYIRSKEGGTFQRQLTISTEDFVKIPKVKQVRCRVTILADLDFKNVEFTEVYPFVPERKL